MRKYIKVLIPYKVLELIALIVAIIAKHTADGVSSLLNSLNFTDIANKLAFAIQQHDLAEQFKVARKIATQERNNVLGTKPTLQSYTESTLLYYVTSIRNLLLGKFRNNEQTLGLWGFNVVIKGKDTVSVEIPRSPLKLMRLVKKIIDKHEADDVDTLLTEIDMVDMKDKHEYAVAQHELAQDSFKKMKHAYRERNLALGIARRTGRKIPGTLIYYVTSARDILLGHHRNNEHTLGLWGFEVITTIPSSPEEPTPEFEIATVNGTVVNTATGDGVGGVEITFHTSQGAFQATTSPTGAYTIDLQLPEAELVTVDIAHPGFQPLNEQHMLVPTDTHQVDFGLMPV